MAKKRLYFDIETSPNVVFSWRVGYNINIDYENIVEERAIVCIGYKWEGEREAHVLQWDGKKNDKALLKTFIPILEEADEVVAHYGDRFDLPWVRARAAFHGLSVSPFIKSIDTKAVAKRLFYFNSNRLDYLAQFLGIGEKIDTDFQLWKDVVAGSASALKKMVRYCKKDVELLEKVFLKLDGYMVPKTHYGVLDGQSRASCPRCGFTESQRRGTRTTKSGTISRIHQCKGCNKYYSVSQAALNAEVKKKK